MGEHPMASLVGVKPPNYNTKYTSIRYYYVSVVILICTRGKGVWGCRVLLQDPPRISPKNYLFKEIVAQHM